MQPFHDHLEITGFTASTPRAVPEPGTTGLARIAAAGLLVARRRVRTD